MLSHQRDLLAGGPADGALNVILDLRGAAQYSVFAERVVSALRLVITVSIPTDV